MTSKAEALEALEAMYDMFFRAPDPDMMYDPQHVAKECYETIRTLLETHVVIPRKVLEGMRRKDDFPNMVWGDDARDEYNAALDQVLNYVKGEE